MLKNKRNDLLYLLNIIEYIEKINLYSNNLLNPETLYEENEQMNYNAILSLLTQIGESSTKISEETKNEYTYPWKDVIGLRNRITHDYSGINIYIVFETIRNSLPSLKRKVIQIIIEGINSSAFDEAELISAKESKFYSHIDFKTLNSKL
jgi:uncharacterized protein with HEPN domain